MKNPLKHKTRGPILWAHLIFLKLIALKTLVFNVTALKVLAVNSAFLMGLFQFVPHITLAANDTVDISVSNLADPTVIGQGDSVAFQYFYKNESDPYTAADSVVMSVVLPDGFSAVGSNPAWDNQVGNTFTYNISNNSGEFMVYFNATHTSGPDGIYENTVSVYGSNEDPYMDNNSASSYILVLANPTQTVDLAITDISSEGNFTPGGDISYTISYENLSANTAYGVNIYREADSLIESVSASAGYTSSGDVYNRYIPSLAAGGVGQITINATVSPLASSNYSLDTYVSIEGSLDDDNESDNFGDTSDTVNLSTAEILSDSSSLCLSSTYPMDIVFDTVKLTDAFITVVFPNTIDFISSTNTPTIIADRTYKWDVNGNGSLGIISLSVQAVGASQGASISVTLGDSNNSNIYTSNNVFTISNCTTQGGGDGGSESNNAGNGNEGNNNGGGDTTNTNTSSESYSSPSSSSKDAHYAASNQPFVKLQCINEDGQLVYNYARSNGITTMDSIGDARMCDEVNRLELAKMLSNYIQNVLKKKPDTSRHCVFDDANLVKNQEDREYMTTACQLGVMGLKYDGTPDTVFNPYNKVTRDIFATAFSRLLYGDANNGNATCWYCFHILALEKAKIITHNDPKIVELRAFIMLMMMRADQYRK